MMLVLAYTSGIVLFLLILGKVTLHLRFSGEIRQLFSEPTHKDVKPFNDQMLVNLPLPVQRYLHYTLNSGQPTILFARIRHTGTFKTGLNKKWISITGEQYATTSTPGFIWKGETNYFTARDMFISGKGRLVVSLLSLIKVVDAKGASYDEGELLRWLGESVLYPTNLLPGKNLSWTFIDQQNAKLNFTYKALNLYFIVTVNDIGQIIRMETKRYMDPTHLETWLIEPGAYKAINNVMIPTYFEVSWLLKNEKFTYARFRITQVGYNIPKAF